jgi:hypothetical protein
MTLAAQKIDIVQKIFSIENKKTLLHISLLLKQNEDEQYKNLKGKKELDEILNRLDAGEEEYVSQKEINKLLRTK